MSKILRIVTDYEGIRGPKYSSYSWTSVEPRNFSIYFPAGNFSLYAAQDLMSRWRSVFNVGSAYSFKYHSYQLRQSKLQTSASKHAP